MSATLRDQIPPGPSSTKNGMIVPVRDKYTVPFVFEAEVPPNYIPICPTLEQLRECEKHIVDLQGESKEERISNITVQAALESLDLAHIGKINFTDLDIRREIHASGKLYFLCKLMQYIVDDIRLTDMQIVIITENPIIEKLMYKIFKYFYGYDCARISRMPGKRNHKFHGYACGVVIRLQSYFDKKQRNIVLSKTDVLVLYDGDIFLKKLKHIKSFLGKKVNPYVFNLTTIGSLELRVKHYLYYSESFPFINREIFINDNDEHLRKLIYESNGRFSAREFLIWNDTIGKQVKDFLLGNNYSFDYLFSYPTNYYNPLEEIEQSE